MKDETEKARLIITWDRVSGQAHFDVVGLSHVEAMRLLLGIMTANFEHALEEAQSSPALTPRRATLGSLSQGEREEEVL